MTRRQTLLIGLGLPLWASESKEFWNEKKPDTWTDDERRQLLTRSPWAREAETKFNAGPGSLGSPLGAITTRRGTVVPGIGGNGGAVNPGGFEALVRWESALPIREADRHQSKDDPAAYYILSVTGDVPMVGRADDETQEQYQARLDNLKEYTRLEKRGGPIYLVKTGDQPGKAASAGTRFYFERNDLITLHDGQATFITKLGPLDLKCKFSLKEMVYQGRLEL